VGWGWGLLLRWGWGGEWWVLLLLGCTTAVDNAAAWLVIGTGCVCFWYRG